mgnify:CR=1 FL=1
MPERFRGYENEPWKSRGLKMMPVDNYCVLYISDMEHILIHNLENTQSNKEE